MDQTWLINWSSSVLLLNTTFLQGIWIGMIIGTCLQTLILVFIVYKTNWNKEVSNLLTLPDCDFVDMNIIAASMFRL
jgi:Na+-driven multidrug efflux pump